MHGEAGVRTRMWWRLPAALFATWAAVAGGARAAGEHVGRHGRRPRHPDPLLRGWRGRWPRPWMVEKGSSTSTWRERARCRNRNAWHAMALCHRWWPRCVYSTHPPAAAGGSGARNCVRQWAHGLAVACHRHAARGCCGDLVKATASSRRRRAWRCCWRACSHSAPGNPSKATARAVSDNTWSWHHQLVGAMDEHDGVVVAHGSTA